MKDKKKEGIKKFYGIFFAKFMIKAKCQQKSTFIPIPTFIADG